MGPLIALGVAALVALGVFLLLRRSIVAALFGLSLLGYAGNLFVLAMGRLRGKPPILPEGATPLDGAGETERFAAYADPLPQALVLTAIVIGFGMTAFVVALALRQHALGIRENATDDADEADDDGSDEGADAHDPNNAERA
jgi:multicomponent K+:H+ antiporter subunit C